MKQTYIAKTLKASGKWYAENESYPNHWAWGDTESDAVDNLIMVTGFDHRYMVD